MELSIHHIHEHNVLQFIGKYQGMWCEYFISLINLEMARSPRAMVTDIVNRIWYTLDDAYKSQLHDYDDNCEA